MRLFTVNAFAKSPLKGNLAGVCVIDKMLSDEECLLISKQVDFSETAFVTSNGTGYDLKWFSPEKLETFVNTLQKSNIVIEKYDLLISDIKSLIIEEQIQLLDYSDRSVIIHEIDYSERIEEFKIDSDWIDMNFFDFMDKVVLENKLRGKFCGIIDGGQGVNIIYLTPEQYTNMKKMKLANFLEN
jgi:hypothetical protein